MSNFKGNKYILYGIPERYLNHSCNANTKTNRLRKADVATRDIKNGEEITANYPKENVPGLNFKCKYGSKKCKEIIKN
ncbi:SET domain-containing protein-lysine N-methyltransferase [Candidatus Pacearchaeota archaeon]|nr:SET domain-containing protein-lysine N-methyltransferase [Candidatus Pacearchaeota archaeon]